jgi:hypothetical protein
MVIIILTYRDDGQCGGCMLCDVLSFASCSGIIVVEEGEEGIKARIITRCHDINPPALRRDGTAPEIPGEKGKKNHSSLFRGKNSAP